MARTLFAIPAALALALTAAGCVAAAGDDIEAEPSAFAMSLTSSDAGLILGLVNYPGTDVELLDRAIGLDVRAARGIVAARSGPDSASPSDDDRPFTTIQELDAVPYVGDTAFVRLNAYALAHPVPSAEIVEGVMFAGWESQAVTWGVNNVTEAELDALLDTRAANALAAHRPYATVTQMGPEPYVGTTALGALRGAAPGWWTTMRTGAASLGGTFDGVSFDEPTARVAVEIASLATSEQLVAQGMTTTTAGAVIGGRPYATVQQISAVSGVGTATMQSLHDYAASGMWMAPAPATFLLDDAALAAAVARAKATMHGDTTFGALVLMLAGSDAATAAAIFAALDAEIDRLSAPLLGTRYVDQAAADAALAAAADPRQRVRDGGWTYLTTLGLIAPHSTACIESFVAAVQPHLVDVLLLSESDRAIEIVSYPGQGTTAPTASRVRSLAGVSGSASTRSATRFYSNLEPSSDMADPGAAAAIQAAITAQLTDVIYVAVVSGATVNVYLVGRTSCGDLLGLHSVAIET